MGTIKNFIEKIKNARYGKDVRQSIVDAIEQTYDDAIANGHTDMEVVKARGNHNDLNDRLEADRINTEEKIIKEENSRKEVVNSLQNQINGLASGSPLVASSISEMTDTTRIYVNIKNGHWYFYNGTVWIDSGVYQSTKIGNNTIEYKNLKYNLQEMFKITEIEVKSSVTKKPTKFSQSGYPGIITRFKNPKITFKNLKIYTQYNDNGNSGTLNIGILPGSTELVDSTYLSGLNFIAKGSTIISDNNVISERIIELDTEVNSDEDYLWIFVWKQNEAASGHWLSTSGGDNINLDFITIPDIENRFITGFNNPYISSTTNRCAVAFSIIDYTFKVNSKQVDNNMLERIDIIEKKINNTNTKPLDNIITDGGFTNIFTKIACIGDSLTAGQYEANNTGITTYNTFSEYSYPAHMKRVLNCDVKVFASGGQSALEWNNSIQANKCFLEENKCEAYIIALGTNDIGYYGEFSGDISSDIDLGNYENNAKTSVGNYAKIIQRIKSLQEKAKIFCCTIPNTRNNSTARSNANIKIREIVKMFNNCYLIDLERYGVQNNEVIEWKEKYYMGGHMNSLGYKQFSNMIMSYIDFIIRNNPSEFNQIPFIGTNLSHI